MLFSIFLGATGLRAVYAVGPRALGEECGRQFMGPDLGDCVDGLDCVDQALRNTLGEVTTYLEHSRCEVPTSSLGQKCGNAFFGPPYPDCKPWYSCIDQFVYDDFGEVMEAMEFAVCERPVNLCYEERLWWFTPAWPLLFKPTTAEDIGELSAAAWDVNVLEDVGGTMNPVDKDVFLQTDRQRGIWGTADLHATLKRNFGRAYSKVRIQVEAGDDSDPNGWVDVQVHSKTNDWGKGIKVPVGTVKTLVVDNVSVGDYLLIKESRATIKILDISPDCGNTPANGDDLPEYELTDQPNGPTVQIGTAGDCQDGTPFMFSQYIWAPDQCQRALHDPVAPLDHKTSIKLSCSGDGGVVIMMYKNGMCRGQPEMTATMNHLQPMVRDPPVPVCLRASVDPIIRAACAAAPAPRAYKCVDGQGEEAKMVAMSSGNSYAACEAKCDANDDCVAFDYTERTLQGDLNDQACRLYKPNSPRTGAQNVGNNDARKYCYKETYNCEPGQGEDGKVIAEFNANSKDACMQKCDKDTRCVAFDYSEMTFGDARDAKTCRLYRNNGPRLGQPGAEQRKYCEMDTMCGLAGKLKGTDRQTNAQLRNVGIPQDPNMTACWCERQCKVNGGFEWQFKPQSRKCKCYQNVKKVDWRFKDSSQKAVVGFILPGSTATILHD